MCDPYDGDERRTAVPEPRWSKKFRSYLATAVFALLLAVGATGAGVTVIVDKMNNISSRQDRVATCLLEQLTEHRLDSRYHYNQEAMEGQYPYPEPNTRAAPPELTVDLEICKEFQP